MQYPNASAPLIMIKGIPEVAVFVHDPDDLPVSFILLKYWDVYENVYRLGGQYAIKIKEKTTIKRLKHPYRSYCSDGTLALNVFPGPYTRDKCKRTCIFNKMLNKCGGVPDIWRKYLRSEHESKLNLNRSQSLDIAGCMERIIREHPLSDCYCPLPCEEVTYNFQIDQIFYSYNSYFDKRVGQMEKWFEYMYEDCYDNEDNFNHSDCFDSPKAGNLVPTGGNPDMYLDNMKFLFTYESYYEKQITEIPAYPIEKFFSDIGGWLGLLVGMSALSLVELLAFGFFSLTSFILLWRYRPTP